MRRIRMLQSLSHSCIFPLCLYAKNASRFERFSTVSAYEKRKIFGFHVNESTTGSAFVGESMVRFERILSGGGSFDDSNCISAMED